MMTWTSFHLHYRDDQDRMLVDCIRPAISRAASMGMSRWFFLRHWKGGAHVRLRFCVPQPAAVATVKELSELIDEYFARFPSRAAPPDEKVLAGLRRLAWLEDDRVCDRKLVVAALPGDTVEVTQAGVFINGRLWPDSKPLEHDPAGRSMS